MNYGGVVEEVALSANVSRKDAKAVLDALAKVVPAWLLPVEGKQADTKMPIPSFGVFVAQKRKLYSGAKGVAPFGQGGYRVAFRAFEGASTVKHKRPAQETT